MVEFANGAQANMRFWGSPYNPMVATCWAGTWTCVPKEDDSAPFMTMQNYAADVQDMGGYGMGFWGGIDRCYAAMPGMCGGGGGMGMFGPAEAGFLSSLGQQFAMNGQAADQNYMSQALLASQNTMVGMQGALNEIAASPDVSDADAAKAGEYADKIAEKMDEINDIKTDDTLTNQERSARIRELQRDIKQIEREAKTLVENYQAQKGFNTAIDSYVSKLDSQSNALDELAKKAGATSDQQEKAKTLKKKIDDKKLEIEGLKGNTTMTASERKEKLRTLNRELSALTREFNTLNTEITRTVSRAEADASRRTAAVRDGESASSGGEEETPAT